MTDGFVLAIQSGGSYIDLPDPAYKGYSALWEELNKADRNTLGFLIKERIATKFTVEVEWHALSKEEKDLVVSLTNPNSFGARIYSVMDDEYKYIPASTGMYRGSGMTITPYGKFDGARFQYYDVTMSLIER